MSSNNKFNNEKSYSKLYKSFIIPEIPNLLQIVGIVVLVTLLSNKSTSLMFIVMIALLIFIYLEWKYTLFLDGLGFKSVYKVPFFRNNEIPYELKKYFTLTAFVLMLFSILIGILAVKPEMLNINIY